MPFSKSPPFQSRLNVQRKILLVVVASVFLSLVTAITLFIVYDRHTYKENFLQEISILSDVLAKRSSAALLFGDSEAARTNLNSLSIQKAIQSACIFDLKHTEFARYIAENTGTKACPKHAALGRGSDFVFDDDQLVITKPIEFRGGVLGHIAVAASLAELQARLIKQLLASSVIFLISIAFAYLFALRVQRFITRPITQLQSLTRKISESQDYSLRAKAHSQDEIGLLVQDFNSMLHVIQETNMRLFNTAEELREQKKESDNKAEGAEERSTAIKEFFLGVSHDLKQPLSAINLFANVLMNETDAIKRQAFLEKLSESACNLNNLFDELLDISKLENIMHNIHKQEVALKPLLESIVKEFEVLASDKNLHLRSAIDDVLVVSDPMMLSRIIRNLLANAIRYTNQGGILLAVRARGEQISIEVWDTGIGMSPENVESIFQPYNQIRDAQSDPSVGFGLGLSIVKRLVDGLDHRLTVRSQPHKGSVFKLLVPKVKAGLKVDVVRIEKDEQPFKGKNIIIIDDEASIVTALNATTSQWGFAVQVAGSLKEVHALLTDMDAPPDLVLTDYRLSEEDTGLEALEIIEEYFDAPVSAIVITGEINPATIKDIEYHGCFYLPKPVDVDALQVSIQNVFAKAAYR